MSDDDREPEDAHLRALRSVWLSLPDEDPPNAGLAELMAAARARAEVLAQPPRWRRLFVQLRKPPILAFATLLVVVGGAIAIGRHSDTVDQSGPVTAPAAPATPASRAKEAPASPDGETVRSKALPSDTITGPGGDGDLSSQGGADKAVGGGGRQDATGTAPVTPPADGAAKAGSVPTPKLAPAAHHSSPPKKPSVTPAPEPKPALQPAPELDRPAAADTARPDAIELKQDTAPPPPTNVTAAQGAAEVRPVAPSKAPTDDELVSQARAAAARGDCVQANAISARVGGRQSRQLAADPAIAKCATK